jgi:Zn-dependent protease with chaperone function
MVTSKIIGKRFKQQVQKSTLSMILFLLLYFSLVFLGVGVLLAYAYLSYYLISLPLNLFSVIGAIFSATMAIVHMFFLFEFTFLSQKKPTNNYILINKLKEEKLINLIHTQAKSLKAPPPGQVYLSPELDFGLFYKYPRLSAALPIRKKLHLGCALFNILNEQELKAILTHEFAHHSNIYLRIASTLTLTTDYFYNILYSNKLIDKLVNRWQNASPVFVIFIYPSSWFVRFIQNTLRAAFQIANQNILAIRRQNDYYADEVAVAKYGKEALQTALLKIEVAKSSFEEINKFIVRRKLFGFKNFYEILDNANVIYARHQRIPLKNNVIQPNLSNYYFIIKSRVREITEWDKIPSIANRIKRISHNDPESIIIEPITEKYNLEKLNQYQHQFTNILYKQENHDQSNQNDVISNFEKYYNSITFDPVFNEYFNYRTPLTIENNKIDASNLNLEAIFHPNMKRKAYKLLLMQYDIDSLNNIMLKQDENNKFTFKDIRKDMSEIHELIKILEDECKILRLELTQTDKEIDAYLRYLEKLNNKSMIDHFYKKNNYYALQIEKHSPLVNKIERKLSFLHKKTEAREIVQNFSIVKQYETVFKTNIKSMLYDELYISILSENEVKDLRTYSNNSLEYFNGDNFNKPNLDLLYNVFEIYKTTLNTGSLISKKRMSEYLIYLHKNTHSQGSKSPLTNSQTQRNSSRVNLK